MGKKGGKKSSGATKYRQAKGDAAPAPAFNKKDSRHKKLQTYDDAFGGDEDEFHKNRDTVFFDDNDNAAEDLDDISDEDEVYGLNLPSKHSSDEEEEEFDEEDGEEAYDSEDDAPQFIKPPKEEPKGRFAKVHNPLQDQLYDQDSDASDAEAENKDADSEDEEETWAANAYHATNKAPAEADSSDEEALELEAEEARRLQKKARGAMAGEDFGLGDEEEEDIEAERQKERKARLEDDEVATRGQKDAVATEDLSEEQAVAYLLKNSPETLALLDDFTATAEKMKKVEQNLEIVRVPVEGKDHPALAILELEHQALATYLTTLAFYFSLLLTPAPAQSLVDKVLARLSSLRSSLATMEELDLTSAQVEDSDDDEEEDSEEGEDDEDSGMMFASDVWDLNEEEMKDREELLALDGEDSEEDDEGSDEDDMEGESLLEGLDDDEIEQLMSEMPPNASADDLIAKVQELQRKKGVPVFEDDEEDDEEDEDEDEDEPVQDVAVGQKRKRGEVQAEKKKGVVIPTLAPLASTSKKSTKAPVSSTNGANDDFIESTTLSAADSSDKASKRHTLRFHVSQVHQKQMKREAGNGRRIGGDDDLPRRSKERSRREVLKRQEHGGKAGEALDEMDWDEEDKRAAGIVREEAGGDDGDGYYDLVKQGREEGRAAKKAAYDSERAAEKAALDEAADESAAGPRGVNRKILANKGLTPKRAKVNRNPRVKKRMRYDKAVKKVATMKSVYKGGEASRGQNDYSGEKSGIGAKVVKSVRLS
ncbi:hypothetical protein MNV49_004904 [Pseudohyphozyma bogoriensis]|nr:hypothetical protein MNV49_004904 [Pseudohyphozyma bogoriensis]